jgi:DNA modification methylase
MLRDLRPLADLIPWEKNPRAIGKRELIRLKTQILTLGQYKPFLITKENIIIGGNMRSRAYNELTQEIAKDGIPAVAQRYGVEEIQVTEFKRQTEQGVWVSEVEAPDLKRRTEYALSDNDRAGYYIEQELKDLLEDLPDLNRELFSVDLGLQTSLASVGNVSPEQEEADARSSLQERFLVPPFSLLDARKGYWQERKKHWVALGIESEVGREENLIYSKKMTPQFYHIKEKLEKAYGKTLTPEETLELIHDRGIHHSQENGTSIFDPVLCEAMYRWFTPEGGKILDPFAGGSVRGIVAGFLGYHYTGCDLSEKQIEANRKQAEAIQTKVTPEWIVTDSAELDRHVAGKYDLVFSCPPYADLEKYSDDPADLSNMEYPQFKAMYKTIIKKAVAQLKDDRFAIFVVGEIRSLKDGIYRNFIADTIEAFQEAGAAYYNECIFITPFGSLPVRAGKIFNNSRKIGKTHQNVLTFYKGNPANIREVHEKVLMFYKGNPKDITNQFPEIDLSEYFELEAMEAEAET